MSLLKISYQEKKKKKTDKQLHLSIMLANQLMTGTLTVRIGGLLLTDSSCWAMVNWRRLVKTEKMDSHSYDKPYCWHTELMTATNGEWFLLFYVRPLLKRTMVPLKSLCVQVQYLIVSIILSYQKHFFPVWGSWIFYSSLGGKKNNKTKQTNTINNSNNNSNNFKLTKGFSIE